MADTEWDRLVAGKGCPFDPPRPESNDHWDLVAPLAVSSLYLSANQTYRGHCQLVLDLRHASRPDQLSAEEWQRFCADLYEAQNAIVGVVRPDHVNVELLGNVVPHLHWHIIPRYKSDPRWLAPIWRTTEAEMPVTRLPEAERTQLIQELRNAINSR